MELLTSPEVWVAFATLLLLEIVLGIDNVVFISILSGKLPPEQQAKARTLGLSLALITRLLLLLSLSWIIGLTADLFTVFGMGISGRDLILLLGGLFLLGKATYEIHEHLEGNEHAKAGKVASFASVITQILILDIVFSLDSVITAVGMVDELAVMVAAVVIAMGIMLVSAGPISDFVGRHPTVKMLALTFLVLIGASLIAEGFEQHIPKGYVYGPIAFSILVEFLNLRAKANRAKNEPVHLRATYVKDGAPVPVGAASSSAGTVVDASVSTADHAGSADGHAVVEGGRGTGEGGQGRGAGGGS
ncbi:MULTISPECIES: TerC family protein [Actinoalloteichus]|uniref:Integral membrane protein TerC n=1 Tax=Actinoalloteichus fjordicus TaxID=1612552 RepID=A0AAC9LB81_9PSEU|nr:MULTISPECIES: TerC family protein [Actinoalloteichus]APU14401.1 integral membrane protein TerC [Actinoalloteichus fjordicus]APU20370.1 integral membrane protein TerC [Actinoalloteichus sp. GBA129-24]